MCPVDEVPPSAVMGTPNRFASLATLYTAEAWWAADGAHLLGGADRAAAHPDPEAHPPRPGSGAGPAAGSPTLPATTSSPWKVCLIQPHHVELVDRVALGRVDHDHVDARAQPGRRAAPGRWGRVPHAAPHSRLEVASLVALG